MTVRKLFKAITKNWPAKLFCFAIAIIVVLFNRMSSMEERYLSIPFRVYSNSEFIATSEIPKSIKVSIRGDRDDIYTILNDDLNAYADFRDINEAGNHERAIRVDKTGNALYMNPLEIYVKPAKLNVLFDHKKQKKIALEPVVKGVPPDGFELSSYLLSTDEVIVEGPESIMERLNSIKTLPVSIDGHSDNFSVAVDVDNKNPLLKVVSSDIKMSVNIARIMVVKNLTYVPVSIVNCPADLMAISNVMTGTIKVETDSRVAESIKSSDAMLTIDLSKIKEPGVYKLPLRPEVPKNVSMISFTPDTAEITITVIEVTPLPGVAP